MYLVGGPHPHKFDAQILLRRLSDADIRLVTDAEVLQEIVHRFSAIKRNAVIDLALQAILDVVDEVFPIMKTDVLRAAQIVQHPALFSARDALHIAVMERMAIRSILTFDSDFDKWPGLERIYRV